MVRLMSDMQKLLAIKNKQQQLKKQTDNVKIYIRKQYYLESNFQPNSNKLKYVLIIHC